MFDVDPKGEVQVIKIEKQNVRGYCSNLEGEPDGKPWYHDIQQYIEKKEYPLGASENDKRTIRRLSGAFFLNGNILYKRNHGIVSLRYVDVVEANKLWKRFMKGYVGLTLVDIQWHERLFGQAIIG